MSIKSVVNNSCGSKLSRTVRLVAAAALGVAALASGAFAEEPVSEVAFTCADDKSIEATFFADKVDLTLSDGRSMSLPQTIAASGIRYADADETFVFWSKGDTAFVTEGSDGEETFADCVAAE